MHFALLLFFYFLLSLAVLSFLIFPPLRQWAIAGSRQVCLRAGHLLSRIGRYGLLIVTAPAESTAKAVRHAGRTGWHRRHALAVAALLLILPPLVAVLGRDSHVFRLHQAARIDDRIQALLTGERLATPAALPPDMFTTREVELIRPQLVQASRDWDLLDAEFRHRLLLIYQIMREEHGYEMVLLEGYRSPERQEKLAAMGTHVTQARAFQSYHQFGLAADSAFLRNGKIVITEKDPWAMRGYELYGETAEKVGLTWGGRWKMMDFGHVEYRHPGARSQR
ncbi:M15 family metallopeptidase [Alcaligenes sp. SDU_A2]|uniref:M15 family metallopeptidase n=1 Tax=Alcaligenes sp. SDU_A2 TaxID=3136634 RepID=UPI00311E5B67